MAKTTISDRKVVLNIAKILLARLKGFSLPADQDAEAAIRSLIAEKAAPLITYGELADELNVAFKLVDSPDRFKANKIDEFLGILLKESVLFRYGGSRVVHNGKVSKKLGRNIPITAIVVNKASHVPGGTFYKYFDYPYRTNEEKLDAEVELLKTLFQFNDWKAYKQSLQKVFDK